MKHESRCPREVARTVCAFARAVKMEAEMADQLSPDPLTEYHAKEYLDEMETLLLHQLLTGFSDEDEREDILESVGLGYLPASRLHGGRVGTG